MRKEKEKKKKKKVPASTRTRTSNLKGGSRALYRLSHQANDGKKPSRAFSLSSYRAVLPEKMARFGFSS